MAEHPALLTLPHRLSGSLSGSVLGASTHRLRKQFHVLLGKFLSEAHSQSFPCDALTGDAFFVSVFPCGFFLRVPRQQPHHFKVLLNLEQIDEGVERRFLVLVHPLDPFPGVLEVVACQRQITLTLAMIWG